ncbi:WhiB family transcriptional regulator [Nocardia thailandica]
MEHTITDWRNQAACRGSEPELWFALSSNSNDHALAREMCEGCPVRISCGQHAHDSRQKYGIWAGFDMEHQRRSFLTWARKAGIVADPLVTCRSCGGEFQARHTVHVCPACRGGRIPAAPYREWLEGQLDYGFTLTELAGMVGLARPTLHSIIHERPSTVTQATAAALDAAMAVTA